MSTPVFLITVGGIVLLTRCLLSQRSPEVIDDEGHEADPAGPSRGLVNLLAVQAAIVAGIVVYFLWKG